MSPNVGVHRLIELQLGRPVQRIGCAMHMAELPARHLLEFLDEGTSGPIATSGPLGEALRKLNDNLTPFVNFEKIETNVPIMDRKLFCGKQDLIFLYDFCHGIANSKIPEQYLTKEAQPIHSARFNTTFCRLLNLYCRQESPSEELKIMVTYISQAYAPTIFSIVLQPHLKYGSFHFFNYLKWSKKCLSVLHFNHVKKYFIKNAYFCHSENILLACVLSEDKQMSKKALNLIKEARKWEQKSKAKDVRKYITPTEDQLDFEADNPLDLLKWDKVPKKHVRSPPLLKHFTIQQLEVPSALEIPEILCHSQHNEGPFINHVATFLMILIPLPTVVQDINKRSGMKLNLNEFRSDKKLE